MALNWYIAHRHRVFICWFEKKLLFAIGDKGLMYWPGSVHACWSSWAVHLNFTVPLSNQWENGGIWIRKRLSVAIIRYFKQWLICHGLLLISIMLKKGVKVLKKNQKTFLIYLYTKLWSGWWWKLHLNFKMSDILRFMYSEIFFWPCK